MSKASEFLEIVRSGGLVFDDSSNKNQKKNQSIEKFSLHDTLKNYTSDYFEERCGCDEIVYEYREKGVIFDVAGFIGDELKVVAEVGQITNNYSDAKMRVYKEVVSTGVDFYYIPYVGLIFKLSDETFGDVYKYEILVSDSNDRVERLSVYIPKCLSLIIKSSARQIGISSSEFAYRCLLVGLTKVATENSDELNNLADKLLEDKKDDRDR